MIMMMEADNPGPVFLNPEYIRVILPHCPSWTVAWIPPMMDHTPEEKRQIGIFIFTPLKPVQRRRRISEIGKMDFNINQAFQHRIQGSDHSIVSLLEKEYKMYI